MTEEEISTDTRGSDPAESILRRRAQVVQDLVQLVDVAAVKVSRNPRGVVSKSTYSRPLKMGFPPSSSARMQPTLHKSIAFVYTVNPSLAAYSPYPAQ